MMLLSDADWQRIHQRAALPTFGPAMQRLWDEAADFLARPVAVPPEPGGYYHDYFCPEHGVQLHFDLAWPQRHVCPIDNAIWQGERFDAAWRWFVNNRLAESAIRLALLWRLEGNPAHLEPVIRTLTGYAEQYATYQQIARTVANPGVATYTTLDESVWVLPLAWAYEMVWEELSPTQQRLIQEQLFVPVAEHLIQHHFGGIHNFACWHNAAIGTLGVVLARDDLIDFALGGDYGCDQQLRQGVLADGLWFEGSFSYHFYTLYALLALAKAMRHLPVHDLRARPELRLMLLAPIHSAYPDGSLPATNDCWYFTSTVADCCHGVPPAPAFYEIGYDWYDEAAFGQVLQRAYAQTPRDSLDALLFGRAELPDATSESLPSTLLPASGYAILRSDPDTHNQRYLLLKYGPHGGGHGHPDKLNLILYACGQRFSPDLGTPGYGLNLFESWYRQTASHNTVTIDGSSQPEATGELRSFQGEGPFQAADASVGWTEEAGIYGGVSMRRVVLARPAYFLDLFVVEAPEPRRIDWLYRNGGSLRTDLPLAEYPGITTEGEGYQHISAAQRSPASGDWQAEWRLPTGGLVLFARGAPNGEVLTGVTPGNPPSEQAVTLIQRRTGRAAVFATLFHPYGDAPTISAVEWAVPDSPGAGWVGCRVTLGGQREDWLIQLRPDLTPPDWFAVSRAQEKFTYRSPALAFPHSWDAPRFLAA
ncbi:MAG: heparinase II/III family protein [Chloroflexi bacterium]|nr:heparinase II/III family protein [Chloroflexota bacterium]